MPKIGTIKRELNIGDKFGRLTVMGVPFRTYLNPSRKQSAYVCVFKCACGQLVVRRIGCLNNSGTRSCGCYRTEVNADRFRTKGGMCGKHGRLYNVWRGMIQRCHDRTAKVFNGYGSRGIEVCEEWRKDAGAFIEWAILNGYHAGLQLDRHPDNDGDYEPTNCRWVTARVNNLNKRNSRRVHAFGETKTVVEWSLDSRCQVKEGTLRSRIRCGVPIENALTQRVER